jgi:hypothetical protein
MPPIPPPGMAGASFFFGASATMASVVIIRPAIDVASCQCDANDLRRVDDAGAQHVDILLGLGVEAEGLRLVLKHFAHDDRTLHACVFGDLADWASSALSTMLMPDWMSAFWSLSLPIAALARRRGCAPSSALPNNAAQPAQSYHSSITRVEKALPAACAFAPKAATPTLIAPGHIRITAGPHPHVSAAAIKNPGGGRRARTARPAEVADS